MTAKTPRKQKALTQVFPEVLYPGNTAAHFEACFILGTLPKEVAGKPGPFVQERQLISKKERLFCNTVLHFDYDPLHLGAGWESKPHVWLFRQAQQVIDRWHFLVQAQYGMLASECNAEWPRLIEGGTHILWKPIKKLEASLLHVRQNGTVVPHNPL